MNNCILIGRLAKDPEVRYTNSSEPLAIARYTIAVDRGDKDKNTDFINCVALGKNGSFAEKYLHKGMKIAVEGRIQTGSYTDKDGNKRYTTDVLVNRHEFVESKSESKPSPAPEESFMNLPESLSEEIPFN
jgi:single-strand DNA-binding protein